MVVLSGRACGMVARAVSRCRRISRTGGGPQKYLQGTSSLPEEPSVARAREASAGPLTRASRVRVLHGPPNKAQRAAPSACYPDLTPYTDPMIDTSSTSPWGELLYNLLAAFSQFERSIIAERVKAGMARA
jgi:hypothetical protein